MRINFRSSRSSRAQAGRITVEMVRKEDKGQFQAWKEMKIRITNSEYLKSSQSKWSTWLLEAIQSMQTKWSQPIQLLLHIKGHINQPIDAPISILLKVPEILQCPWLVQWRINCTAQLHLTWITMNTSSKQCTSTGLSNHWSRWAAILIFITRTDSRTTLHEDRDSSQATRAFSAGNSFTESLTSISKSKIRSHGS